MESVCQWHFQRFYKELWRTHWHGDSYFLLVHLQVHCLPFSDLLYAELRLILTEVLCASYHSWDPVTVMTTGSSWPTGGYKSCGGELSCLSWDHPRPVSLQPKLESPVKIRGTSQSHDTDLLKHRLIRFSFKCYCLKWLSWGGVFVVVLFYRTITA